LNWVINVSLIFSLAELTGEYDWIRNRIGLNSEKRFNNSWFMKGLEVENKSATPILQKGLVKAQKS
jgi:hypothetical protein